MSYEQFCDAMKRGGKWPLSKRKIFNNAHKAGYREGYLDGYDYAVTNATPKPPKAVVDIVFERLPGPDGATFIDVESPPGTSIKFGEWIERADGYAALRIQTPAPELSDHNWREEDLAAMIEALKQRKERMSGGPGQ